MSLFHKPQLAFAKPDPLADGLGDDIRVEQTEEGHFELTEQLDMRLADDWEEILTDARKDPDFTFVQED
jgi:hypothetical protein